MHQNRNTSDSYNSHNIKLGSSETDWDACFCSLIYRNNSRQFHRIYETLIQNSLAIYLLEFNNVLVDGILRNLRKICQCYRNSSFSWSFHFKNSGGQHININP